MPAKGGGGKKKGKSMACWVRLITKVTTSSVTYPTQLKAIAPIPTASKWHRVHIFDSFNKETDLQPSGMVEMSWINSLNNACVSFEPGSTTGAMGVHFRF